MIRARVRRTVAATIGVTMLMVGGTFPVAAHVVGQAGDPNCLGMRVSHGANHSPIQEGHGLTPVERRDLVEQVFGEEIPTIGDWIKFVKTCPAPPDFD